MNLLSRTAMLVALNVVVLLGGGLVSYGVLSPKVEVSVPPPVPAPAKAKTSLIFGVAAIEDDTILSKPIFRRSRQKIGLATVDAPDSAKSKAEAHPPPIPPSPVLVGVLRGTAGQNWVLLEGGGGTSRRLLAQGGEFEGWRVLRIRAKEVILRHRQTKTDITARLPSARLDTSTDTK